MKIQLKPWQTLEAHSSSIINLYPIQILNLVWPELVVGIPDFVQLLQPIIVTAMISKLDIAAVSAFQFIIDENHLLN